MCWNVSLCVFLQFIPKSLRTDCWLHCHFFQPWRSLALHWLQSKPSDLRGFLFLFVWVPGFPTPVESSGSADVPLTMTMLSLWPWHHSRLWIINRGPDSSAGGLFVGKQGVISLSRQAGLMACHKYIKRGSVAISSDLHSDQLAQLWIRIWALPRPHFFKKCFFCRKLGSVEVPRLASWLWNHQWVHSLVTSFFLYWRDR